MPGTFLGSRDIVELKGRHSFCSSVTYMLMAESGNEQMHIT